MNIPKRDLVARNKILEKEKSERLNAIEVLAILMRHEKPLVADSLESILKKYGY